MLKKLTVNSRLHQADRQRLIKFNIIPHKLCNKCGQTRVWNGKPLTLQLDHINGDPTDNRIENLRFLCPNCHTQTDTWCARKIRKYCKDCNKEIGRRSKRCLECSGKKISKDNQQKRKFDPPFDILKKEISIDKIPMTQLGKKYGVSDVAVKKRAKFLGII